MGAHSMGRLLPPPPLWIVREGQLKEVVSVYGKTSGKVFSKEKK